MICSGKIYYDILAASQEKELTLTKCALTRLEQIYPFPAYKLNKLINGYENLKQVIWVQEEPKNMGAYFFVKPRLDDIVDNLGLKLQVNYIGRDASASPATGSSKLHKDQQDGIVAQCLAYY